MPLPRQKIRVDLKGEPETLEVEAINPDYVRYEMEAKANRLNPDPTGNMITYLTFLAWAALRRTGQYAGDWQTFKVTDCLAVEGDDDEEDVDPTKQRGEFDSVSSLPSVTPEPPSSSGSDAPMNDS